MNRLLAALALWALSPAAGAQPVSREDEERMRAQEAEREALVELALPALLDVEPETFHGPLGRVDRPTLDLVNDLLQLDWTLALLAHGGAENLDRIRATALAARRRQVRDAVGWRAALEAEVRASPAEEFEAGRTAVTVREVLAQPVEKPAIDAPLPPGGLPPAPPGSSPAGGPAGGPGARSDAPLDYIPVSADELRALRDKHRAQGRAGEGWIDQLTADPVAEARWREATERLRQTNLRRTTPMSVERGGGYALGEWISGAFSERDPVRLVVFFGAIGVILAAVALIVLLIRRRD